MEEKKWQDIITVQYTRCGNLKERLDSHGVLLIKNFLLSYEVDTLNGCKIFAKLLGTSIQMEEKHLVVALK